MKRAVKKKQNHSNAICDMSLFQNLPGWRHSLIIYLWIDYLWEQYLRSRQYHLTRLCKEVPPELQDVLPKRLFDNSRRYMLERKRFAFVKDLVSITISTMVILYDILPMVWDEIGTNFQLDEVAHSLVWYIVFSTSCSLIKLPLTIYEIFIIERTRPVILAWEKMRNFVMAQVIIVVLSSILIEVIEMGALMGVWAFICSLVFLVGMVYPSTAPSRFRTLSLLDQGELRREISELASYLNFPLKEIYVEERFKRNSRSLYIYGTLRDKSLVLYDSLLSGEDQSGCTDQQILALVAHEIAHWYYNNSFKYVVLLEAHLILSFAAFFLLFRHPEVFNIFGFHETQPVLVGVYVVLKYAMTLYNTVLSFCFMYFSRKFVTHCDEFVVRLGKGQELVDALVRVEDQLNFPVYDHLYSVWHHDKPALLERVRAIYEKCA